MGGFFVAYYQGADIGEGRLVADPSEHQQQQPEAKPTNLANDESKRWRGGRGPREKVEERANWTYAQILQGGTRRQITAKVVERFGCSQRTADDDYSRALELLRLEQSATRSDLLNQLQALRLAAVRKAMAKGQLQTVAILLADMGKVIGEAAPEQLSLQVPELKVSIED